MLLNSFSTPAKKPELGGDGCESETLIGQPASELDGPEGAGRGSDCSPPEITLKTKTPDQRENKNKKDRSEKVSRCVENIQIIR